MTQFCSFLNKFIYFWPCHVSCGILVPRPGIKPVPPALGVLSLNHWTTREVCRCSVLVLLFSPAGLLLCLETPPPSASHLLPLQALFHVAARFIPCEECLFPSITLLPEPGYLITWRGQNLSAAICLSSLFPLTFRRTDHCQLHCPSLCPGCTLPGCTFLLF